jgi:hypothetical protein
MMLGEIIGVYVLIALILLVGISDSSDFLRNIAYFEKLLKNGFQIYLQYRIFIICSVFLILL